MTPIVSPEMIRFNEALKAVLKVPKQELVRLLADEKANTSPRKAGRKPNASALAHASHGKS